MPILIISLTHGHQNPIVMVNQSNSNINCLRACKKAWANQSVFDSEDQIESCLRRILTSRGLRILLWNLMHPTSKNGVEKAPSVMRVMLQSLAKMQTNTQPCSVLQKLSYFYLPIPKNIAYDASQPSQHQLLAISHALISIMLVNTGNSKLPQIPSSAVGWSKVLEEKHKLVSIPAVPLAHFLHLSEMFIF